MIARSRTAGCLGLVVSLCVSPSIFGQIRINEILAVNNTVVHDPDFGGFSDLLELHNGGDQPVDLSGFALSEDPTDPNGWVLPALTLAPGEYLVIWADDLDKRPGDTAFVPFRNITATMTASHAGFRLSGDGQYIGLFDPEGNVVDEITYGVQTSDVSYGISGNDTSQWLYFGEPTPGGMNSVYGSAMMETPGEPIFSLAEGFYPGPQTLQLTASEPDAVIRYTYDGSTPTANSPVFTTGLPVNLSLAIKARIYVEGKMPGKVVTKTYFINENDQFPILSISANSSELYDFNFGILQNAIKDREVPATIEYYEAGTGEPAFRAGVGIRVFGTSIYNLPQRPLSVRFREEYGTEYLSYPLFGDKPIPRYSSFLLRNGGNDHNTAFFRDGLGVTLVKGKMDIDHQDYKPCLVFINGAYSGIYELRERLDERYIASNHEINADNLDYLEDSLQAVAGDQHAFVELMEFVDNNDLSDPANYAYVVAAVDVNEFLNYIILRAFIGYRIGDLNNRYWRDRDATGVQKWRWIASDLEHAFGQLGGDPVQENTISKLAGLSGPLPEWSTLLFNRLLQNTEFRDDFIQRSAAYLNTVYAPATTVAVVDSLEDLFQPRMARHIGRWNTPPSVPIWHANIDLIRSFLQERPGYYRQHLTELFGTPDGAQVGMEIVGQGKVLVSGVPFSGNMSGTFFMNASITLQAIPEPGHRFVMWQGVDGNEPNNVLVPSGDTSFVAVFAPQDDLSIIPPLVAQDTTLAAAASPWYGSEDVVVMPGARLTVEAGATLLLTDGVCFDVQGGMVLDGTADDRINVLPDPSPSARRGSIGQSGHWGSLFADTPTDSIILRYSDLHGGSFGRDREVHGSTISTYDTPIRIEHSTITEGKAPLIARGGSAHIAYSEFHTFSSANGFISIYDMEAPLIEHCIFRGNRAINTDAIDLKGITNGIVRHNEVYGFLGSNCDGIDLGIYSLNTLVEHNIIHDCTDKGISIGSQSNALVRRNVIHDCDLGVAVKDSLAVANIDQNTLYGNRIGVACYEKSTLRGGGTAHVKNTILSASTDASISYDAWSEIQVSYSLSDRGTIPGDGNLATDPMLVHPSTGNFELAAGSPCIDTGDPTSPTDDDGSPADMGAYYTHTGDHGLSIHINECSYNASNTYETGDWVELHNATEGSMDISGWRLAHGFHAYVFDENTVIGPGAFLVVCQDTELFSALHPDALSIVGDFHFDMDNAAGKVALYDLAGDLVHSMRYADHRPWPPLADGEGATVELEPGLEGNLPTDWRESHVLMGSPGAPNSSPVDVSGLFVNEVMAANTSTLVDEHGEFDDWFELYNASSDTLNVGGLCITDDGNDPLRWQLRLDRPEQTKIPPHGFLLVWADGTPEQGPLHADLRLSAGGEILSVHQRDGAGYTEREHLDFGPQVEDISYGRYPDGSTVLEVMHPTPGATNTLVSVDEPEDPGFDLFPNPFSDVLTITAGTVAKPYRLILTNMVGQVVAKRENLTGDHTLFQRSEISTGVYTVTLIDALDRRSTSVVVAR
ncbi:MAG TPA: CotH kinase family protein [Flavobacteriales bacterium]|nr:CotH kinase family protein [Flavobacteriales bacterium]